jgi:hypothetical protein
MANVSFAGKSPIDGQVIETNVTVGNGTIQAVRARGQPALVCSR